MLASSICAGGDPGIRLPAAADCATIPGDLGAGVAVGHLHRDICSVFEPEQPLADGADHRRWVSSSTTPLSLLENIMRYIGAGREAVCRRPPWGAKRWLHGAVDGLSLIAVHHPDPPRWAGSSRRLFREFAVTLSVAILVAGGFTDGDADALAALDGGAADAWRQRTTTVHASTAGVWPDASRGYAKSLGWALNGPALLLSRVRLDYRRQRLALPREIPKDFPAGHQLMIWWHSRLIRRRRSRSMSSKGVAVCRNCEERPGRSPSPRFTGGGSAIRA